MTESISVVVRDCACEGTPHEEGDVVYLRPRLSLAGGIAAQQDLIACKGDAEELTRRWMVTFVRFGYAGSNCGLEVDDLLDDFALSMTVAQRADELYGEAVLAPLGVSRPKN